jgi:hypothetical protein
MELIDKGEGLMRYELGEGSQLPPEREEGRRLGSYRNKPATASWEKPRVHHAYSEIKASAKGARRPGRLWIDALSNREAESMWPRPPARPTGSRRKIAPEASP